MSPDSVRDEPGNVGVAAAGHDLPCRLRVQREQPVVVEEADERERGKRSDRVERGRPDGRRHGKQIPMGEPLTETAGLEKVAQRLAFRVRRLEQRGRLPIEAHDLAEQREVRRPAPDSAAARRTRWRRGCCTRARSAGTTRRTTCPSRGWPRRARRTAARDSDTCGRCARGTRCRAARRPSGPRPARCWCGRPAAAPVRRGARGAGGSGGARPPSPEMPAPITAMSSSMLRNTSTVALVSSYLSMTND